MNSVIANDLELAMTPINDTDKIKIHGRCWNTITNSHLYITLSEGEAQVTSIPIPEEKGVFLDLTLSFSKLHYKGEDDLEMSSIKKFILVMSTTSSIEKRNHLPRYYQKNRQKYSSAYSLKKDIETDLSKLEESSSENFFHTFSSLKFRKGDYPFTKKNDQVYCNFVSRLPGQIKRLPFEAGVEFGQVLENFQSNVDRKTHHKTKESK